MPKPIPVAIRRKIVERHQAGETLVKIASEVERPYESVRNVWRLYQREGRIEPNYGQCGRSERSGSRRVQRVALWLKRAHPSWGAQLIRTVIGQKWSEESLPHERTLQRWFRRAGVHRRPQGRQPRQRIVRGQAPHDVWEMDSKQHIRLANEEKVSWLLISDEKSGAVLEGRVFPHSLCQPDYGEAGADELA